MRSRNWLLLCLFILTFTSTAHAKVDDLIVWQPDPNSPVRYVIPRVHGKSDSDLMAEYQRKLKDSKVYSGLENTQKVDLPTKPETFTALPPSTSEHPNVAVVLNRPNQMVAGNPYLPNVVESFQREGPHLFSIPVGLEETLSPQDMKDFRRRLNQFDGQLGVGGNDPHPLLYGQQDTSRTVGDISLERDQEQIKYIQEYRAHGKGRVFYICGSMQRAAIADGHGFHDEIAPSLTAQKHKGVNDTPVMIEVETSQDSELAYATGKTRFMTSNVHHAAINPDSAQAGQTPSSKVTAYNIEPDGTRGKIAKSIDFPDNAGFATQFHPEMRGSEDESNIVRYVATGWKLRARVAPSTIVHCLKNGLENLLYEK